jgi:hypothetical protein
MLDRAEAAQVSEIIDIDMVIDLIAALAQQCRSCPGMALRRHGSRVSRRNPGGRELRVETGIDGIQDFAWYHWRSLRDCSLWRRREGRRISIKPYFAGRLQPLLVLSESQLHIE